MSAPRTIRFGIVGTGLMAAAMAECLALEPRAQLVGVASTDVARARAFASRFAIATAHADLAALLASPDVDAVYIANATRDHARTAIAALAVGKAVLCEKPFALDLAEATQVAEAAARHGRLFVEAQWTVHLPAFLALKRLVESNGLGAVSHVASTFGRSLDAATHRRLFEGPGAGVLLDFAVYPIVLARALLGPVTSVRAALAYNAARVDVQASLQLTHAGGGQSQLGASLVAELANTSSVSGSHGLVTLVSPVMGVEALALRSTTPARGADGPPAPAGAKQRLAAALRRQAWVRRLKSRLQRARVETHAWGADRYAPQLAHFIALLDAGALQSDRMPIAVSLDVMRVIEQARADCPPPEQGPST
ncbi:MAG: Gfo/Idh/MocA family oxidoreductase [Betaproteobacteria bacterium]